MAAWRLRRSGGPDTDTAVVLPARAACGAAELRRFVAWWAKKEAASMAMMSSDDAAQQRTPCFLGLQARPQAGLLGRQVERQVERVLRHDIIDELNEEAAITNAQVQRAEQMCLARNAKNRAKRERKREKVRAATVDALFMPDMSRAVGEAVCEANANEKADAVARWQGAMHCKHEAMAHSLSGYAGRSDEDSYKERARHWLTIMKHLYDRAFEEYARLEVSVARAKAERDEANAERDRASAERDRAKAERDEANDLREDARDLRDQMKAALERVERLMGVERLAALEREALERDRARDESARLLTSVGDHGDGKGDECKADALGRRVG